MQILSGGNFFPFDPTLLHWRGKGVPGQKAALSAVVPENSTRWAARNAGGRALPGDTKGGSPTSNGSPSPAQPKLAPGTMLLFKSPPPPREGSVPIRDSSNKIIAGVATWLPAYGCVDSGSSMGLLEHEKAGSWL